MTKNIAERNVDELIEYATNPREIGSDAVDKLAAMIHEFGFRVPIIAKSDGLIVDGHLRLLAAKKLGMTKVPCLSADDMSDSQIKAFRIAVNKAAEFAAWDDDLLAVELQLLKDEDFDMDVMGFEDGDIDALIAEFDAVEMPTLAEGDKDSFQTVTFTMHDEQVEQMNEAMDLAKNMGDFDSMNTNSNANAIARVCETFLTQNQ